MKNSRLVHCMVCAALALSAPAAGSSYTDSLKSGKAAIQSAGPMAFGPDGILFVGDSRSAAVFALDTGDRTPAASDAPIHLQGVAQKVAALLGTTPDQVLIADLAVNPVSRRAYLSVSRGRGPEAEPVILRVDSAGKLEEFSLDPVRHSSVSLPNPPGLEEKDRRGRSRRREAITDLAFVDGAVIVAGLSNEEFSSKLRSIPFPFSDSDVGTSVEIFHGAHGRWETNAPVRTFVPYEMQAEAHILAAYTCTPLVKFPLASLKPGTKVVGTTIAELGNRNRPLDMIVYEKNGEGFILMSNSSRGVMKMPTGRIHTYGAITERTSITGLPYQTLEHLKGVEQLDRFDAMRALILARNGESLDLETIPLP